MRGFPNKVCSAFNQTRCIIPSKLIELEWMQRNRLRVTWWWILVEMKTRRMIRGCFRIQFPSCFSDFLVQSLFSIPLQSLSPSPLSSFFLSFPATSLPRCSLDFSIPQKPQPSSPLPVFFFRRSSCLKAPFFSAIVSLPPQIFSVAFFPMVSGSFSQPTTSLLAPSKP